MVNPQSFEVHLAEFPGTHDLEYYGARFRSSPFSPAIMLFESEADVAKVIDKRMTVDMEGEFVVFLIGMRINKFWKIHKWLPVLLAMPKMLKELETNPECGCLGHSGPGRIIVQYWRSFEHLEAYARDKDRKHWPAWIDFNRRVGGSRGDVGVWHETYIVKPGNYEALYSGMPPFGLGKAGALVPAAGKGEGARSRITALRS